MMTLATVTGDILGEFKDHADAVNYLIDHRMTGNGFVLAGTDWKGKFGAQFIDISEAGNAAKGMAVVYLTECHGKRWHYISTPFPKAMATTS